MYVPRPRRSRHPCGRRLGASAARILAMTRAADTRPRPGEGACGGAMSALAPLSDGETASLCSLREFVVTAHNRLSRSLCKPEVGHPNPSVKGRFGIKRQSNLLGQPRRNCARVGVGTKRDSKATTVNLHRA